ncbi:MAG: hypothetical protein IH609_20645, partial [Dehalococcoidia bacterium]|nr:hypothetical protein [Dehalococcoidia bacterium]
MAVNHHGRWRIALLGLLAAATILAIRGAPASSAATTAEGPLSPVADSYSNSWNKTPNSLPLYEKVADVDCQPGDPSYVSTSTGTAIFWVGLAPSAANNGKAISRVDLAICYRAGASAGAGFTPFVRLDGTNYDGSALTASSTTGCQETVQPIVLPVSVQKADTTILEIGALKSGGDTKTVRICSIRATIYYEDDNPPPLPTITKSAATTSLDADSAYWDITIDNTAAGAVGRDGIAITDGFADAVLESVTPVGACAGASGALSPWTCDVAAGGTTVLRVSRPRSALTDA